MGGRVAPGRLASELSRRWCRLSTPMAHGTPDLLPGTLDLLILRTLQRDALHGWAISERIQRISEQVLKWMNWVAGVLLVAFGVYTLGHLALHWPD